jgi:pimeloyl-ACP methyl ester carboxylesterase
MGGDAAWDIGLAHPDLWAGVIPVAAVSGEYCSLYWENAKLLPFYFVCGEYDGTKMFTNATDFDRYLKANYHVTVVEYLGRGHEHFSDEIQRLFDWMGRYRRSFFPAEFEAKSMRPWDRFFWWVELDGMPPKSMVYPDDWPPPRGARPFATRGMITATNGLHVTTGAEVVTVWLSPEMVDLKQRCVVVANGRRINSPGQFIEPDLETLLEDVRRRGDRQHPFWAKLESTTGRAYRGR